MGKHTQNAWAHAGRRSSAARPAQDAETAAGAKNEEKKILKGGVAGRVKRGKEGGWEGGKGEGQPEKKKNSAPGKGGRQRRRAVPSRHVLEELVRLGRAEDAQPPQRPVLKDEKGGVPADQRDGVHHKDNKRPLVVWGEAGAMAEEGRGKAPWERGRGANATAQKRHGKRQRQKKGRGHRSMGARAWSKTGEEDQAEAAAEVQSRSPQSATHTT